MKYTVLVQRPDWIADPYGLDTYIAHVEAQGVFEAQDKARDEAWEADHAEDVAMGVVTDDEKFDQSRDYAILAVFEGHLQNIGMEE